MEIRALDAGSPDELSSVLELFKLVYRWDLGTAFYRWRFLDNPFGSPLVTLLWDGATLAGHYAASPMIGWYGGRDIPAAQSMTTMTHPEYRNRGVFTTLATDLYARMEAQGIQMIWGLPNTQSHYGFVTKLGWRDVALLFTMTRVLKDTDRAGEVEELAGVPASATSLWQRSDDGRVFASRRDERYLRWRYVANPQVRYHFFTLPGRADDLLFVGKEYATSPTTRSLEIVDYLYGRDPKLFGALMRNLLGWAQERGFATVRTWMAMADPAFGELEKLAFVPREPLAYFGARTFAGLELPATQWNHAGFYLTMGDSDNF